MEGGGGFTAVKGHKNNRHFRDSPTVTQFIEKHSSAIEDLAPLLRILDSATVA